jgi:cell division protein YceG involved in septum cleavage
MEQKTQTKTNIIALVVIVILVLIVGGVIYWQSKREIPPLPPVSKEVTRTKGPGKDDSTDTIFKDLESVDIGNLDQEFKEIDQDLNSL